VIWKSGTHRDETEYSVQSVHLMCVLINRLQKGWDSPSQTNLLWYVKDREVEVLQIVCLMM